MYVLSLFSRKVPLVILSYLQIPSSHPMKLVTSLRSTCDTFRLSTCHQTSIYLHPIHLFATHGQQGLSSNKLPLIYDTNFSQNRNVNISHLYSVLFRVTQKTGLKFSYITCCLYISRAISTISFSNLPIRSIFMFSSVSALIKETGMSHIPTSCPSCAYFVAVISTDYVVNVGKVTSLVTSFWRFFRPSAHIQPFTFPSI